MMYDGPPSNRAKPVKQETIAVQTVIDLVKGTHDAYRDDTDQGRSARYALCTILDQLQKIPITPAGLFISEDSQLIISLAHVKACEWEGYNLKIYTGKSSFQLDREEDGERFMAALESWHRSHQ